MSASLKAVRRAVLDGIAAGAPRIGPHEIHIDVTNGCNARCITCWDHSPLLETPRPASWKRQRLSWDAFERLVSQLEEMGSVRHVILSGMGEPLTHPDIYRMIARIKDCGWSLTVLSNLVAADAQALLACPPDNLLVGVHGARPETYMAFHPGWTEEHFFTLCGLLRQLVRQGVKTRHVQVIDRTTAPDVPAMIGLGRSLRAERVNYKLASLAEGTQATAITDEQRDWLLADAIPEARALAERSGVRTNLDLFERQVRASTEDTLQTTAMDGIGCSMGYVYTRIAVDGTLLYCCNTAVEVGHIDEAPFAEQWSGPRWQAMRARIEARDWLPGCERCGKVEQNVKWAARRAEAGL